MKIAKILVVAIILSIVGYLDYTYYNSLYHFIGVSILLSLSFGLYNLEKELRELRLTFKRWLGL